MHGNIYAKDIRGCYMSKTDVSGYIDIHMQAVVEAGTNGQSGSCTKENILYINNFNELVRVCLKMYQNTDCGGLMFNMDHSNRKSYMMERQD